VNVSGTFDVAPLKSLPKHADLRWNRRPFRLKPDDPGKIDLLKPASDHPISRLVFERGRGMNAVGVEALRNLADDGSVASTSEFEVNTIDEILTIPIRASLTLDRTPPNTPGRNVSLGTC
jgi:hypothetical protein